MCSRYLLQALATALLLLGGVQTLASPTADYMRKHLDVLLDTEVVVHVVQLTRIEGGRDFLRYYADTAVDGRFGGTITVLVPTRFVLTAQDLELFEQRVRQFESYFHLSTKVITKPHEVNPQIPLRGMLVQHGPSLAIVYDLYPVPLSPQARE